MVRSVKGMLMGGAAVMMVVPAAFAADLPVTKSQPVEYVRVCSAEGDGFFFVPGTDSCIRIGGHVRAEFGYTQPKGRTILDFDSSGSLVSARKDGREQDATGFRARGRLDVDVRTPTDYGTLRAFLRYEIDQNSGIFDSSDKGALLEKAFIQWAGLTAGHATSFFDFYANDLNWANGFEGSFGSDLTTNLFAYTATFGNGFSATLSIEDANARRTGDHFYDAAGQRVPDVVANLNVEQDWGSAQLAGALHQLNSASIYTPLGGSWGQRVDTTYGWAVQGGVKLDLSALAKGDVLWLQGTYADGALSYIGIGDIEYADFTVSAVDGAIVNGDIKKTRGWNATAAFLHYWTPGVRQSLFGSYSGVSYNTSAKTEYADLRNFDAWSVGSNVIWSPVSEFDIGVEVLYSKVDRKSFQNELLLKGQRSEDVVTSRIRLQRDF